MHTPPIQRDADAPVQTGASDAPEVSVYSAAGRVNVSVSKPMSNPSALTGYEYQLYEGVAQLLGWTSAGVDATTLAGLAPGAVSSFAVGGFLDEIGNLPVKSQRVLLHVLEQNSLTRVGGRASIPIDVRVVAATNTDLTRAVQEGTFREDWERLSRLDRDR